MLSPPAALGVTMVIDSETVAFIVRVLSKCNSVMQLALALVIDLG